MIGIQNRASRTVSLSAVATGAARCAGIGVMPAPLPVARPNAALRTDGLLHVWKQEPVRGYGFGTPLGVVATTSVDIPAGVPPRGVPV